MDSEMIIKLNVSAICLVCKLDDGRLAIMHDTEKGESGPELHTIVAKYDSHGNNVMSPDEVYLAVLEVLDAEAPAPKKRSLKRDADAKDAIMQFMLRGGAFNPEDVCGGTSMRSVARVTRLMQELGSEGRLAQGPNGRDWTSGA